MANPLAMKLEQFTAFSDDNRCRLDALANGRQRTWAARKDIVSEGDGPREIHLVMSGMAARYKDMPNGERQITAFLIPGDLCDLEVFVLDKMDHGIIALTETTCALVSSDHVRELLTEMQGLTEALWWSTMTDTAVLRDRIVGHGQRDARERLAHLFYEMLIRYRIVGMATANNYPFPLTQSEMGEATGLTSVHVNRVLQQLRADGLVEHRGRMLSVLDPAGLKRVARFNSRYLHLRRTELGDPAISDRTGDLI